MEKKFTVGEIEDEIVKGTAYIKELESKCLNEYDEMQIMAAGEDKLYFEELLQEYYPHAFDRDFVDEEIYNSCAFILDREHHLSPEMILKVTKIDDNDKIYVCKVRSFHNGKFVNNYVHIYLDGNYTDEKRKQYDAECACAAICYAIEHEFIAVLDITEVK